jgi:hypothetical protein
MAAAVKIASQLSEDLLIKQPCGIVNNCVHVLIIVQCLQIRGICLVCLVCIHFPRGHGIGMAVLGGVGDLAVQQPSIFAASMRYPWISVIV